MAVSALSGARDGDGLNPYPASYSHLYRGGCVQSSQTHRVGPNRLPLPVRLRRLDTPYRISGYRSTDQTCDHSVSFFKLNHFFCFAFSVLSGSRGVLDGFGSRPSLRASSFAIR